MIRRLFRQMMLTQIVSAMTVTLCMLIDSAVIARHLGVNAVAAYGFAAPVVLAFAAPGAMISAGVQVVCGRAMGSGDREGTDACFTLALTLSLAIAAVGTALVLCFSGPLCTLLGAGVPGSGDPAYILTKRYLTGMILGVPAFLPVQILVPFMQMAGRRRRLVVAVLLMTASDVAFDLLNVYVFHGGMFGMGAASTLSYYIALVTGGAYFLRRDCLFHFRRRGLRADVLRPILKEGVPTVVNQLSLVLLVLFLNHTLSRIGGNMAVAAYSVISTLSNLCYAFGSGIGSVALMLAAVFYTDEDRASLHALTAVACRSAVVVLSAVTLAVLLGARPVVGVFLADKTKTMALAVRGLRLFALCLVPSALNTTLKFFYQGTGRVRLMELISVLQNFALPALAALALGPLFAVTGVWLCFLCGEGATLLLICLYVWHKNARVSIDAESFALLPPGFGADADDCYLCSVQSIPDAAAASEGAMAFCRAHGRDGRMSALVALCIEEITVNIIRYGFGMDSRRHNIDVRLILREGESLIRIRDDCANFDPVHYLELHRQDNPGAHLGIRMVMAAARDASYLNSYGLNNLTLRL